MLEVDGNNPLNDLALIMAINLNDPKYNDAYDNLKVDKVLFGDIATDINSNEANVTNMKTVTDKFSARSAGNVAANSGVSYPGIAVSTLGVPAQSVYEVTMWIQTSSDTWITLKSLAILYWNGSTFSQRGITELGRTLFSTDVINGAKITFSSSETRFRVEVPNLTTTYNWACSYIRLL